MERTTDETMQKTLIRFSKTLEKKIAKKSAKKKPKTNHTSEVSIGVSFNNEQLPIDTLTNNEWKTGMRIVIDEHVFDTVVNPPLVEQFNVFPRKFVSVGSILVPSASLHDGDTAFFSWFVENEHGFEFVATAPTFVPSAEHCGRKLKAYCTPQRSDGCTGRSVVCHINHVVEEALTTPAMVACRADWLLANPIAPLTHRIVTYNILADPYATSEYCYNVLYNYVQPPSVLELDYRSQLIATELVQSQASVICLQECDQKLFDKYLSILLKNYNYSGNFTNKDAGTTEGCATFIHAPSYTNHRFFDISLKKIMTSVIPLEGVFAARSDVEEILTQRLGTVAQLTLLQKDDVFIIVANTHLFYHPSAGYARLLQTATIVHQIGALKDVVRTYGMAVKQTETGFSGEEGSATGEYKVTVILAGDLNSTPETAVIEYIEHGIIQPDHGVWHSVNDFYWGMNMEKFVDEPYPPAGTELAIAPLVPTLQHPFAFVSAAGYPTYTNFHRGFQDILDYIYVERDVIDVVSIAPFPSVDVLRERVALPSVVFPSDHMAVMVDIQLKNDN